MAFTKAALLQATTLTRKGLLLDATRLIQQHLGWRDKPPALRPQPRPPTAEKPFVLPSSSPSSTSSFAPPSFSKNTFRFAAAAYPFGLYQPSRSEAGAPLPVLVMLHGCKQDGDDFARGTAMNAVAEREGLLVVYPEQLREANGMGCWNWFEPQHQQRGQGEPAMIAALAQHVVAAHGGDPARVYVAGLSAGGAMAALAGQLYPDVFAAVGVHSGLPPEAAHDMVSAFSAMRKGARPSSTTGTVAIPTIVFHGSADKTVAPANSEAIVREQLAASEASGHPLVAQQPEDREDAGHPERKARRMRWVDTDGLPRLESWAIDSAPHAWSGGNASGSFTDPAGPSASEAMVRFFLVQARKQ